MKWGAREKGDLGFESRKENENTDTQERKGIRDLFLFFPFFGEQENPDTPGFLAREREECQRQNKMQSSEGGLSNRRQILIFLVTEGGCSQPPRIMRYWLLVFL